MTVVARLVPLALVAAAFCATAGAVGRDQLSLMPLPQEAIGRDAAVLMNANDSGVDSNQDAAWRAGHGITAAKITRDGRIEGFTLDYVLPSAAPRQNLLGVRTMAELYRSPGAAAKGVAFWHQVTTWQRDSRGAGIRIVLSPFSARLGDGAFGYQLTYQRAGKPVGYLGDVVFRTGRLVGVVFVTTNDEAGLQARTLQLAHRLLARMRRVAG